MRYLFTPLFVFLTLLRVSAQFNHVPNCSFEQYTTCPTSLSFITSATGWDNYTAGSSDYFNACATSTICSVPVNTFGNENAAHGSAYAGFHSTHGTAYREYITRSITPLVIGTQYEVSISASLADNSSLGCTGLGVFFFKNGQTSIGGTSAVSLTPQADYSSYGPITTQNGWIRLTKKFIADSTYDHIAIGNFGNPSSPVTAPASSGSASYVYYYVDSIVVMAAVPINYNYPDTFLCAGDTVRIPFTLNIPGHFTTGNIYSLQLSGPTGSFLTPTTIGTLAGTSAGTIVGVVPRNITPGTAYRIRITGSTPLDTTNQNGKDIIIRRLPNVSATSNSPVCEQSTLNLVGSSTSTGTITYDWTGPGSYTAANNQTPNRSPAAFSMAGDYVVTATLLGCSAKDTTTVAIKLKPATPVLSSNSPVCPNTPLNLTASSATPGVSYSWNGPNSFLSTAQNPAVSSNATYAMAGTYAASVSLNGCISNIASTSVAIQITTPTPVASANLPICYGLTLNLNASNIPGATYNWRGPSGFTSTSQNPTITNLVPGNVGKYIVTATLNGCTSQPDTVDVPIQNVLIGAYASPNDTICQGFTATFVAFPQNPGIIPAYQWYKNFAPIPGATSLIYATPNLVTGDKIHCAMTATGVCPVTVTVTTDTFEMVVLPIVTVPSVEIKSDIGFNVRPTDLVRFTADVKHGGITPKYQWFKNGTMLPGARYATLELSGLSYGAMIHVDVISEDPCSEIKTASDTVWMQFPTGIQDRKNNTLSLYPNPNHGAFTVTGIEAREVTVEVVNAIGQVVYKEVAIAANGAVTMNTKLIAGSYLLKITADGKQDLLRFSVY